MADLKQPSMDGTSGRLARCCQGRNKNKLYSTSDPCEDPKMRLVVSDGECECVECTGTLEEPDGSCQKLGYSACYVCQDGKCVKGPLCCSNTPGKRYAGCYKTEEEIQDDVDCCVNEYIYVEFTASATTSVSGRYDTREKKRYCNSVKGEQRRFFVIRVDCESFSVESESRQGTIDSGKVTCGCPKGKYNYTIERLWKTSPAGYKAPARGLCRYTYAHRGLVNLAGPDNGQEFSPSCWWYANCSYGIVKWTVGTTGSGSERYVSCIKGRGPFSQAAEHPSCTGIVELNDAQPEYLKKDNLNPGNNSCACTGPSYASMEQSNDWRSWCGICSGNAKWVKSDDSDCYNVQPV